MVTRTHGRLCPGSDWIGRLLPVGLTPLLRLGLTPLLRLGLTPLLRLGLTPLLRLGLTPLLRLGLIPLLLLAWVSLPASAAAANLFTLDTSFDGHASVAVNAAGTGFFAWEHRVPGAEDVTMECAVLRGGTCSAPVALPAPPGSSPVEQPLVVLGAGGTVYVVGPRYVSSDVVVWTSNDNGQSWQVSSVAQPGAYHGSVPTAALLSNGSFLIASHNPGLYFTSVPTTGPGPATGADLTPTSNPGLAGSAVGVASGNPVEAAALAPSASGGRSQIEFTSDTGSGDPNASASWTPLAPVSDGIAPSLASGPSGLFLASEDYAGAASSATSVSVRKFDGAGFGAPVTLQADTANDGAGSIFQTPGLGQLLVAWQGHARSDGTVPLRLYTSGDGGATFVSAGDIAATASPSSSISGVQIAAADDGGGFATFAEASDALRVADLRPQAPPGSPPVARAAFVVTKAALGKITVDASTSKPPGAAVKSFAWKLDGGTSPAQNALCGADVSQLTTRVGEAGTHTLSLTVTDSHGATSSVTHSVLVSRVPRPRTESGVVAADRTGFEQVFVCSPGPGDHPGDVTSQGGPPSGCATEVQFGLADAVGCLKALNSPADYPSAEGKMLAKLNERACTCGHLSSAAQQLPLGTLEQTLSLAQNPYASTDPVRINGIDFYPQDGASILLVPNQNLVISSNASMKLGGVTLKTGQVLFFVDQGSTRSNTVHIDDYTLSEQAKRIGIGGFPFDGTIGLDFAYHRAQLPVHVTLPNVFAAGEGGPPIEGSVTLSTDNSHGLLLDQVDITVPKAFLGPLEIDNLFFHYARQGDIWAGGGDVVFPGGTLKATPPPPDNGFGLAGGRFDHAGATLTFEPPLEIFTGVDLSHISFTIGLNPTRFTGGAGVDVVDIAKIDGSLAMVFASPGSPYDFPADAGAGLGPLAGRHLTSTTLAVGGALSVITPVGPIGPLAEGYLLYEYPDYVEFGGRAALDLGFATIDGQITGFAQVRARKFNVEGQVEACLNIKVGGKRVGCLGVYAVLSSNGLGACGTFPIFLDVPVGIGYRWGDSTPDVMIGSCDVAPYRAVAAAAAGSPVRSFTLRSGLPAETVRVLGSADAPRFTLIGPRGERIENAADGSGAVAHNLVLLPVPKNKITFVGIKAPTPGTWKIIPQPGSSPIIGIEAADGLPSPQVRATVSGAGATRTLAYRVKLGAGQTVTFAEKAGNVWHVLGEASGTHGQLRFQPTLGAGGVRRIVGVISSGGVTRSQIAVASFRAPVPTALRTPARLRLRHRGSNLEISWRSSPGAHDYTVSLTLSDGRQLIFKAPAGRPALHVARLALTVSGSVRVVAIGPLGEHSRVASINFPRLKAPRPARIPRLRL